MTKIIWALMAREWKLVWRRPVENLTVWAFFLMAVALFPLAVGPDQAILSKIAPGIIWVTVLLAAMLSFDRLFTEDAEDGSLEQLFFLPIPLSWVAFAKICVHWVSTGAPLLLLTPLLTLLLSFPQETLSVLLGSLTLGTFCVSLLGSVGASLTLGSKRSTLLMPLLVLPFLIPVLLFGVGAVEASLNGLGAQTALFVLAALFAMMLPLAPLVIAVVLRQTFV